MDIVEGVRKLGFRKWYERQLIEAHAWLVTGFLLLILAFALFEVGNDVAGRNRFLLMAAALASVIGCFLAWQRYQHVLAFTELAAELAICPHCATYGRLSVVRSTPHRDSALAANPLLEDLPQLQVRCRQCAGEWHIKPVT